MGTKDDVKKLMQQDAVMMELINKIGMTLDSFMDLSDAQRKDRLQEAYDKFRDKYTYHTPCPEGTKWNWDTYRCEPTGTTTPPPVEPPSGTVQKDEYGINKIYADKPNGVKVASTAFKEEEFTRNYDSGKPSENSYECEYKDSNKLENEEVTFYCKINGFKNDTDTMSVKLLGNKHSDGSKDKWLIFQLLTDGGNEDNFQIEDPHPKNTDNHQPTLFTVGESIVGKVVGFKAITYIDEAGKRHAETWLDFPTSFEAPANNWRRYIDIKDVEKLKKGFLHATNGGALLRIDGTKKGDMPTTKFMSIREIIPVHAGGGGPTIPPTPPVEPPIPPTPPTEPPAGKGTVDKDGIMIPFKLTGKSVPLTTGNDHRNGQRYSVNHKFVNYMMVGYFKTGKGQKQIEMKTDGPNHGDCLKLPECCWCEVDWLIEPKTHNNGRKTVTGEMYISSEHPHPENHPPPLKEQQQSSKVITGNMNETWLGFAVAAYQEGEFRHIMGFGDINPFGPDGKPANNWIVGVNEVDKGQITTPELAKRQMPINYDEGMECEIRMHGATSGDCQIKLAKVYEIVPPS